MEQSEGCSERVGVHTARSGNQLAGLTPKGAGSPPSQEEGRPPAGRGVWGAQGAVGAGLWC